jgi:hypothetical protein
MPNYPRPGPPLKHERYSRVKDHDHYGSRIEEIFGKKDPKDFQKGRKIRKKFHIKSNEELEREMNLAPRPDEQT